MVREGMGAVNGSQVEDAVVARTLIRLRIRLLKISINWIPWGEWKTAQRVLMRTTADCLARIGNVAFGGRLDDGEANGWFDHPAHFC